MTFYEQCEQSIELIEGIQDAQKVARLSVCGKGEKVAEGRGNEGGELLLGKEL